MGVYGHRISTNVSPYYDRNGLLVLRKYESPTRRIELDGLVTLEWRSVVLHSVGGRWETCRYGYGGIMG